MACWAQLEFSDAISPIIKDFIFFHDHIILVLIFILTYVAYIIGSRFKNPFIDVNLLENQSLEVLWTLFPVFILLYIGAPSLYILYRIDYEFFLFNKENFLTVKIIGHQWYWSYNHDIPFFTYSQETIDSITFDSYIRPTNDLTPGDIRLLDVDNRLTLPCETLIKFYITAADVLHSWTIPSLGIKIDACPGRLNQTISFISHPGVFYGQCSEICGANHSFIPICVEARPIENFVNIIQTVNLYKNSVLAQKDLTFQVTFLVFYFNHSL